MPTVQSPYNIVYLTTGGGSVGSVDCGGLALAGVVATSGGSAVWTLTGGAYPGASSYGTLRTLQSGVGVGTALTATVTALNEPALLTLPVGPVYDLRATSVGTNQTAGTLAVYLRGEFASRRYGI